MTDEYQIRAATPDDMTIIYDSWTKSFKLRRSRRIGALGPVAADSFVVLQEGAAQRMIAPDEWHAALGWLVERMAQRAAIAVAYHHSDPVVVIGWVAFEDGEAATLLDYVWVRPDHRRKGVAQLLLATVQELATDEGGRVGTSTKPIRAKFMTGSGLAMLRRAAEEAESEVA